MIADRQGDKSDLSDIFKSENNFKRGGTASTLKCAEDDNSLIHGRVSAVQPPQVLDFVLQPNLYC